MNDFSNIPTEALVAIANNGRVPARRSSAAANATPRGKALGDFVNPLIDRVLPATSMPRPPGPADFPVQQQQIVPVTANDLLRAILAVQNRILEELIRQNIAVNPVIRCVSVDQTGQTLDWSQLGTFDRLTMINLGPDDVWFQFDMNGPAVSPTTGDNSFKVSSSMSVNLTHCSFQKIGAKCAAGKTALLQGIAFQTVAGNQAGAID